MLRWFLFLLALVLGAASLLTFFKAPNIPTWMAGILVGEFGHWLIVLIVLLVILVALAVPTGFFRQMTIMVLVLTALILAKPVLQAWMISQSLQGKLDRALGEVKADHEPLQFDRLFSLRGPNKVEVKTEAYAYVGTPEELQLDFYHAVREDKKPAPCVIVIHGGGWDNGERNELPELNHYLANHGYAVAAISYRLAPKFRWPAQREDILMAIAFLKLHAKSYDIDSTKLVLFGRSAGGNLAEAVGYASKDNDLCAVVAYYSPADLNFAWAYGREDDMLNSPELLRRFLGGPPKVAKAAYDETSAYDMVSPATLPTLLVHGALDSLVWHKQSERLDIRLSRNSVPHYFLSLPWATHAFDFNFRGPGGQLATFALEHFLAAATKDGGIVLPKPVLVPEAEKKKKTTRPEPLKKISR